MTNQKNHVIASSFADPGDIRRFKACKAAGKTDRECFKTGDNGIGCWGDDTTANTPMVALPPDDWKPLGARARGAKIYLTAGRKTIIAELRDTMPKKENIKNGCGIDLNPAACEALGYNPPVKIQVTWQWCENITLKSQKEMPTIAENKTPKQTHAEIFAETITEIFQSLLNGIRRKK